MTKTTRSMHTMSAALAFLAISHAEASESVFNTMDLLDQGCLQITLGLAEKSALVTVSDTAVVSFDGRVVHGAMLHAFRVEVVDAADRPAQGGPSWDMQVFVSTQAVGGTHLRSLVRLSASSREIALPRPLGFRLGASDSLLIVATFGDADSQAQLFLRLSVDYEPLTGPHSRLAVLPLGVTTANSERAIGATGTATQRWEWKADLTGRLLAIAGLRLDGAVELVLQDVETGMVLWSAAVAGRQVLFAQSGQVIRLGVPVQEGRSYRLTVTYRSSSLDLGADHTTAVAMVLPRRS
jgi:hypothetical protein